MSVIVNQRVFITWLVFLPILFVVVFSESAIKEGSYTELVTESLGFVFLVVATLGRVWCLTYIGGYKTKTLLMAGPYSIVRSPLYVFSFFGGVGFGLLTENLYVAAFIAILFMIYYPIVVAHEERQLIDTHGRVFLEYKQRVPRWIPDFSHFEEPETYSVRPRFIRRAMFGSMWFLWLTLLWEVVEKLRALRLLPVLWVWS